MKLKQLFENTLTTAEKDAKRKAKREEELNAFAKLHAQQQQEKLNRMYDGKPMTITLPVIVSGNKEIKKDFTIDNTLEVRRALSNVKLKDLSQAPMNSSDRKDKPSYIIDDPKGTKSCSIPYRLHSLPIGTARKPGYEPEDLRREAYNA